MLCLGLIYSIFFSSFLTVSMTFFEAAQLKLGARPIKRLVAIVLAALGAGKAVRFGQDFVNVLMPENALVRTGRLGRLTVEVQQRAV